MNDSHSLKTAVGLAAAVLIGFTASVFGQNTNNTTNESVIYELKDGGQMRKFELAMNELHGFHLTQKQLEKAGLTRQSSAENMMEHCKEMSKSCGRDLYLVLYETGKPRTKYTRRIVTHKIVVKLAEGAEAEAVSAAAGAESFYKPSYTDEYVVLHMPNTTDGLTRMDEVRKLNGVEAADVLMRKQQQKRFEPDDPSYLFQFELDDGTRDPLVPDSDPPNFFAADLNMEKAWDFVTTRGFSQEIAIVDDGVQLGHPDLVAHADIEADINFNDIPIDQDPPFDLDANARGLPDWTDWHGTPVAGIAAAVINNGINIAGISDARIIAIRLISQPSDDVTEGLAFAHRLQRLSISNNSWGPPDDGTLLAGPGPLANLSLAAAVTNGRFDRGIVFVFSAGNGAEVPFELDHSNFDGYANSIYTIAVGAITGALVRDADSESGANITCVAFNSATTLDFTGTNGYGPGSEVIFPPPGDDTSAAAPMVSGIIALMIEARPALSWRDIQEILITTARGGGLDSDGNPLGPVDPMNLGWFTNGITDEDGQRLGFNFNVVYGAGLVDAAAAIQLAASFSRLEPWGQPLTKQSTDVAIDIPDGGAAFKDVFFVTEANRRIEQVSVQIDIDHPRRRDLDIFLISPENTISQLAPFSPVDAAPQPLADYPDWVFTSVHFWGECSLGPWTVAVIDQLPNGVTGIFRDAVITFHGVIMDPPPEPSQVTDITPAQGQVGSPFRHLIRASKGSYIYKALNLPPGLKLDTRTGLVTGIPLDDGVFEVQVEATNNFGTGAETIIYDIAPGPVSAIPLLISPLVIPAAVGVPIGAGVPPAVLNGEPVWRVDLVGALYALPNLPQDGFWILGGADQLTFRMINLPPGLAFDGQRGVLSGRPTAPGVWNAQLEITHPTEGSEYYVIEIMVGPAGIMGSGAPPLIDTVTFPIGPVDVGESFVFFILLAPGSGTPYHYGSTNLPPGFSMDSQTGLIFGTSLVEGVFDVGITATNDSGTDYYTQTITIGDPVNVIGAGPQLSGIVYDDWKNAVFKGDELGDPAISGPDGDSDGDGNSNFVEYALNMNPRAFDTRGLPQVRYENENLFFEFHKDPVRIDVEYIPQITTDLTTWNEMPTQVTSRNSILQAHRATAEIEGHPLYVRLYVKQIDPGTQ